MAKSSRQRKKESFRSEREETQPAEEWGDRIATGRAIARGGGSAGMVPGATEHPEGKSDVVMPPAPPGESNPEAVRKTKAVSEAVGRLGKQAAPQRVTEAVKAQTGLDIDPAETADIQDTLRERETPPASAKPPAGRQGASAGKPRGASRQRL